jgi:uncharacterized membrane protein (UPF0127 family)
MNPKQLPYRIASACLALLLAPGLLGAQVEGPQLDLASFPQSRLTLRSSASEQEFQIWIASTQQQQMQGLMFVRDLPPDRGMLFVEERPRIATMWMKNTYIALDMLFIDTRGKVVRILPMTKPFSLDILSSLTPVKAVLELRGGEATRRNIRVGDTVVHEAFKARKRPAAAVH